MWWPPELLNAMSEIAICDVRAGSSAEFAAQFSLEEHFSYRFWSIRRRNILWVSRFLIWGFASRPALGLPLIITRIRRRINRPITAIVPSSVFIFGSPNFPWPILTTRPRDHMYHVSPTIIHSKWLHPPRETKKKNPEIITSKELKKHP